MRKHTGMVRPSLKQTEQTACRMKMRHWLEGLPQLFAGIRRCVCLIGHTTGVERLRS